jgi:hypothetical protein
MDHPIVVEKGPVPAFERIGTQIEDLRYAELVETLHPNIQTFVILFDKDDLPVAIPQGKQVAIIARIEEFLTRRFLCLTIEKRYQVVSIEMVVKGQIAQLAGAGALRHQIGIVNTGVVPPDIVSHDDQDVWFRRGLSPKANGRSKNDEDEA